MKKRTKENLVISRRSKRKELMNLHDNYGSINAIRPQSKA